MKIKIPNKPNESTNPNKSIQSDTDSELDRKSQPNKKKKNTIKLQVNRLFKKQNKNINTIQPNSSLPTKNSLQSIQTYFQTQQISTQSQLTKPKNKIVKTFQELYFQKLKQIKFKALNIQNQKIKDHIPIQPFSCKNYYKLNNTSNNEPLSHKNTSNQEKNSLTFMKTPLNSTKNYPHTTKNIKICNQSNKQNILSQNNILNCNKNTNPTAKYFKKLKTQNKITGSHNKSNDNFNNSIDSHTEKQNIKLSKNNRQNQKLHLSKQKLLNGLSYLQKQGKPKKIINVKKAKNNDHRCMKNVLTTHYNQHPQSLNQNQKYILNKDLNFIKHHDYQDSNQKQNKQIQKVLQNLIQKSVNHKLHQHVWGGRQCFFSRQQFILILKVIGINKSNKQTQFYVNKLWQNLGGFLYGGVVKHNIIKFLSVVLFYSLQIKQSQINSQQSQMLQITQSFVDKSSLKLIKLSDTQIQSLRRFYSPLRPNILAQCSYLQEQIQSQGMHNDSLPDLKVTSSFNTGKQYNTNSLIQNQIPSENIKDSQTKYNQLHISDKKEQCDENRSTQQISLLNNIYLNTITPKAKQVHLMSPFLNKYQQNQQTQLNSNKISPNNKQTPQQNEFISYQNKLVTDFSPKLSKQQYQPFKSTTLLKQSYDTLLNQQQINIENNAKTQNLSQSTQILRGKPLLSVDVNLGQGHTQKLIVYEGQTPYEVSLQLKEKYNIDEQLRQRFEKLLQSHLKTLLFKIEEVSQQLFQDSREYLPCQSNEKVEQNQLE